MDRPALVLRDRNRPVSVPASLRLAPVFTCTAIIATVRTLRYVVRAQVKCCTSDVVSEKVGNFQKRKIRPGVLTEAQEGVGEC